jgi:hypothetical protein
VYSRIWTSGLHADKGFGYARSTDLIHWSVQQHLLVLPLDSSVKTAINPDLYYDRLAKTVTLTWTVTRQSEPPVEQLFVTQSNDFKHFTLIRKGYNPGYPLDGATVVSRTASDFVLVFQDNSPTNKALKAAFCNQSAGLYKWETPPFTGLNTFSPLVFKVGAKWLIFYQAKEGPAFRAVNTLDFNTFENITKEIALPEGYFCGSVLRISGKEFLKLMHSLHIKPR